MTSCILHPRTHKSLHLFSLPPTHCTFSPCPPRTAPSFLAPHALRLLALPPTHCAFFPCPPCTAPSFLAPHALHLLSLPPPHCTFLPCPPHTAPANLQPAYSQQHAPENGVPGCTLRASAQHATCSAVQWHLPCVWPFLEGGGVTCPHIVERGNANRLDLTSSHFTTPFA